MYLSIYIYVIRKFIRVLLIVYTRYHLDLCENVFGAGTYPEVNITNLNYGGTGIAGNVLFV